MMRTGRRLYIAEFILFKISPTQCILPTIPNVDYSISFSETPLDTSILAPRSCCALIPLLVRQ